MLSLPRALEYHLQCNHYPPVSLDFVPVCLAAIQAADNEDAEQLVDLPEGVTYKYSAQEPAWAIIEQFHLGFFLNIEEEEGEDADSSS